MRTIKNLTTNPYTTHLQGLLKSRRLQDHQFKWTLHSEMAPPQIVSIRAIEGHLGRGSPRLGNRLLIQALVRFDSMQVCCDFSPTPLKLEPTVSIQTLEIYSKKGGLVSPKESSIPRRVTEYLVFERRMWYDVPWKIKQQMFERSG